MMRSVVLLAVSSCFLLHVWAAPADRQHSNGAIIEEKTKAAEAIAELKMKELQLKIASILVQDELHFKEIEVAVQALKTMGITPTQLAFIKHHMSQVNNSRGEIESFLMHDEPMANLATFLQHVTESTSRESELIHAFMENGPHIGLEKLLILAYIKVNNTHDTLINALTKLIQQSRTGGNLMKVFNKEYASLKNNMTAVELKELAGLCKKVNYLRELLQMKSDMILTEMPKILELEKRLNEGKELTAEEIIILHRFRSNEDELNTTVIRMKLISNLLSSRQHSSCEELLILGYLRAKVANGTNMPTIKNSQNAMPHVLEMLVKKITDDKRQMDPEQLININKFLNENDNNDANSDDSRRSSIFNFPSLYLLSSGAASLEDVLIHRLRSGSFLHDYEIMTLYNNYMESQKRMKRIKLLLFLNLRPENGTDLTNKDEDRSHEIPDQTSHMGEDKPEDETDHRKAMIKMLKDEVKQWNAAEVLLIVRYLKGEATLAQTLLGFKILDDKTNQGPVMNMKKDTNKPNEDSDDKKKRYLIDPNMDRKTMEQLEESLIEDLWILYKLKFNRKYSKPENLLRRAIFVEMVRTIAEHNSDGSNTFQMELNKLADKRREEVKVLRGYRHPTTTGTGTSDTLPYMPTYTNTVPLDQLPATVNWTTTGFVGPVQNQGDCGSCWAFSSTAALQAQYYNKTGTYIEMSKQNLVDCTQAYGNDGCDGGNYDFAFNYVMNVGIDSANTYPYTGVAGNCTYNSTYSVTTDNGWWYIQARDEDALQQAVALVGPVSVSINAGKPSFQVYKSGVYAPSTCAGNIDSLDHAVLLVGYGTTTISTTNGTEEQDYWLIQNSWGTDWGMNGYMMMARNDGNMCGIATSATVPIIN